MKIAIFHELHAGGARRAVNEFAKRLRRNNLVDLYIIDEKMNNDENKFFNNVFFYEFIPKKWSGGNWKARLYKDTIELYRLRILHRQIASDINKNNYDLAFVHPSKNTQAPFILRFLKIPTVYYCEEALRIIYEPQFKLTGKNSFHKRIYDKLTRFVRKKIDKANISSADIVLANSKFTKKNIKKAYGIQSRVSYLGVDTDFFKPEEIKKDIDVLYIGARDQIDGYDLLENALRLIPEKISVNYHVTGEGWVSDKELKRLYNRSKIVVCLAKGEPFGLIPLEAAACGIPVIALNNGGYREIVIEGKTGFLVDGILKVLRQKIKLLLSDEKLRVKIGKAARDEAISNWTWDRSARKIEKIFEENNSSRSNLSNNSNVGSNGTRIKLAVVLLIFIFSMVLRLWTLNQMGRTWDEGEYIVHGYKLTELIKKGDFNNSFFYTSYNHPPLVKYLYGVSAHFDLEKTVKGEPVFKYDLTYSRLLSSLMFSLGVLIVFMIGWKLFSPTVGIISGIILAILPFSLGLSQLVTTESLKILVYPLVILSFILLIEKFSVKRVIMVGILIGIALQAKQSNALLIPILAAALYLQYRGLKVKHRADFVKTRTKAIITIVAIGILVFFAIWPQAVFHFREVYEINQELWSVQFSPKPWQITLSPPEIFFGQLMLTPVFYYAVYFLITIPLVVLFLFLFGVKQIIKSKNLYYWVILLWFLMPFIMSIYSWRQHGLRYIIEIYPAITLIAAIGFDTLTHNLTKKITYKLLLFIPVVIYLFVSLWQIKPYYLDYFNEFVGGTGTVYKYNLFQTGWWGQGEREAGIYLKNIAPKGSTVGLALSPEHTFPRFDSLRYFEWSPNEKYDFVVVNHYHIIRDGFDDSLIRQNYDLVYQVKADRAVLAYIYKQK
ncbi:MAG: glycosyltransferase [Candidatus Levybacteria bacterium]|nr:glycosyltransferase [Candidatus Levybacteria bacterium]